MEQRRDLNSKNIETKTVELPLLEFLMINFLSFVIPLYGCIGIFISIEYLLIQIFSLSVMVNLIILPFLLFTLYIIYILILIEFAAFWAGKWKKVSPPIQGIFKRVLNDINSSEGELIKYYHRRGFIIKFPMWLSSKSPFPWLINRALRKIGHNKIGKNVIYCDSYVGLEFTDLDDNVFIYPTSALSSHAVNSIFGKISILEIKLGKNTILYPGIIVGPGALTNQNVVIYPNSTLHKSWRGEKDYNLFQGNPAKGIED